MQKHSDWKVLRGFPQFKHSLHPRVIKEGLDFPFNPSSATPHRVISGSKSWKWASKLVHPNCFTETFFNEQNNTWSSRNLSNFKMQYVYCPSLGRYILRIKTTTSKFQATINSFIVNDITLLLPLLLYFFDLKKILLEDNCFTIL